MNDISDGFHHFFLLLSWIRIRHSPCAPQRRFLWWRAVQCTSAYSQLYRAHRGIAIVNKFSYILSLIQVIWRGRIFLSHDWDGFRGRNWIIRSYSKTHTKRPTVVETREALIELKIFLQVQSAFKRQTIFLFELYMFRSVLFPGVSFRTSAD